MRSPRAKVPRDPNRPPKVALLVETSNAFARGLLTGIEHYVRSEGPWNVYLTEHGRGDDAPDWLPRWDGDGVLARIENEGIAAALSALRIPVVNLSFLQIVPQFPTVTTDNEKIAELAFQHFRERGFQHFGFCGVDRFVWSHSRESQFAARVQASGGECAVFRESPGEGESDMATDSIATWLRGLPKPVAIATCYDLRGQQVLSACRRAGLSVPEEVAVLGVDNDELICALSPPPLSSVMPDTQRAGWCAAELLARMMAGEKVEPAPQFIAPIGIMTRQSTDTLAVEDPRIAAVLRHIRQHATTGLRVEDVLARFPMARRALERRMKELTGRTPHEEIRRVQMNRARELLVGSKLTLAEVAERCGFRHTEYLTVTFKREFGVSPNEFRKAHGSRR